MFDEDMFGVQARREAAERLRLGPAYPDLPWGAFALIVLVILILIAMLSS